MDNARFAKFAKDSELLGTNLSLTDVDMIFVHVKRRGQRRIDYTEFERAVRVWCWSVVFETFTCINHEFSNIGEKNAS